MGLFDKRVARQPLHYPWAHEWINKMYSGFWTAEEFNFLSDLGQYKTQLTPSEKQLVTRTLTAVGQVEIAVKTFWARLGDHLPHPEISDLGYAMSNSEVIHNLAYEKLLTVLGMAGSFEENLKHPALGDRVKYLTKHLEPKYNDTRQQYIRSIVLFTLFVENASLFSQFYILLHLNKTKAILKDTAQQVNYTRSEEDMHRMIGIKIINTLREEYPELFTKELEEDVYKETLKAIEAENKVIDWLLDGYSVEGLNGPILKAFIKDRMINSLKLIGFKTPKITNQEEELLASTEWFNVGQMGTVVTDFFQQRPTEYSKHNRTYTEDELWDDTNKLLLGN